MKVTKYLFRLCAGKHRNAKAQRKNMRLDLMFIFLQNCYWRYHSIGILKKLIGFRVPLKCSKPVISQESYKNVIGIGS
jgi:hypothetical protein